MASIKRENAPASSAETPATNTKTVKRVASKCSTSSTPSSSSSRKKQQQRKGEIKIDSRWGPYKVVSRGINRQRSRWTKRRHLSGDYEGKEVKNYSNSDGSYWYEHADGSVYFNDGRRGGAWKREPGSRGKVRC